jgi:hypothetical protein
MTRFKLALLLGFALGWAVGSGRAQELWQRMRTAAEERSGGSMSSSPVSTGGPTGHTEGPTTRVASA